MRELVYYVAVSLDGHIAGPQHEFDSFLLEGDHVADVDPRFVDLFPTMGAQHLGLHQPADEFSTVLMGWNTYAVGLPEVDSPYHHLEQIVFSSRPRSTPSSVRVTDEDPVDVVRRLKQQAGGDIWLCGGSLLAGRLLEEIDRLVLKRHPVLFGTGRPLFETPSYAPTRWAPVGSRAYESGVVVSEWVPSD